MQHRSPTLSLLKQHRSESECLAWRHHSRVSTSLEKSLSLLCDLDLRLSNADEQHRNLHHPSFCTKHRTKHSVRLPRTLSTLSFFPLCLDEDFFFFFFQANVSRQQRTNFFHHHRPSSSTSNDKTLPSRTSTTRTASVVVPLFDHIGVSLSLIIIKCFFRSKTHFGNLGKQIRIVDVSSSARAFRIYIYELLYVSH